MKKGGPVNFWILIQVVINIILMAGVIALWLRLNRPPKDDPRLSRGLQLLQTKISVLEDLSDRTETQVNQLTALMEHKVKEIQNQLLAGDKIIQKVDQSIAKSLEVAKIFQDRIPHQEIIERKNTMKYVKAARLAHQGVPIDDIERQVDLSRGEIEFIAKVNRNQLQFSEEDLPAWAKEETEKEKTFEFLNTKQSDELDQLHDAVEIESSEDHFKSQDLMSSQPLMKSQDRISLSELGDKFRQAITQNQNGTALGPTARIEMNSASITKKAADQTQSESAQNSKGESVQVRKVVFPRVDSNSTLG